MRLKRDEFIRLVDVYRDLFEERTALCDALHLSESCFDPPLAVLFDLIQELCDFADSDYLKPEGTDLESAVFYTDFLNVFSPDDIPSRPAPDMGGLYDAIVTQQQNRNKKGS